jgi:hypothetical protein
MGAKVPVQPMPLTPKQVSPAGHAEIVRDCALLRSTGSSTCTGQMYMYYASSSHGTAELRAGEQASE